MRLTFDQKVEHVIQEVVDSNFALYKRITDDPAFGEAVKGFLFDQYLGAHRNAESLIRQRASTTLAFLSGMRRGSAAPDTDDPAVTYEVLKTIAAFLNTEGGDLLIGVAENRSVVGVEHDQFPGHDAITQFLAEAVRSGLGTRAGNRISPKLQIVQGLTVCVVSCQSSPEPVYLKWKGLESAPEGDFLIRREAETVKLSAESAREYARTRFSA